MVLIIALTGIAGTGAWFYQYNQSPVTGVVHPVPVEAHTKGASAAHFSGQTFSIDHPASYGTLENHSKVANQSILEQYLFSMRGDGLESRQISVMVRPGTAAAMVEDSAYKFRLLGTDYALQQETIHGQAIPKTVKKDQSEIAYFVSGKTTYAIIVATSTNPGEEFWKEASSVIESFAWND